MTNEFLSTAVRLCLMSVAMIMTIAAASAARADEMVAVQTKSGRTFRGVVDEKTDNAQLWLRFGTTRAQILRPIEWPQIASVTHNGNKMDAATFQKQAGKIKTAAPRMPQRSEPRRNPEPTDADFARQALSETPPVAATLEITAYPANWDRDVEVDGLVLTIFPSDQYGNLVHVSGTLEVELVTEMSRTGETIVSGESRVRNERIGHWTRRVSPQDFDVYGASFRLPFQAVHPEFDRNLINLSLVNARLAVPGAGTFNASTTAVRIRPLSTVRNRYENRTGGNRFFPVERTGRGKLE